MRRSLLSRVRASGPMRALGAGLLCAAGSLAVKYAPAQLATMSAPQQPAIQPIPGLGASADSGFVRIARQVTPAVVYIEAESSPRVARNRQQQQLPPGFSLPPGFDIGPRQQGPQRSSGSGFIVSADGEILTNNHVVEDANRLLVTLYDRRIFPAKVIGRDPSTDVALIKIDASALATLPLGDDGPVQVGQPVLAIGAPLGLRSTVTSGIISAKDRGDDLSRLFNNPSLAVADFLQTDAVINPGNSGGPLIDMSGRVIGINSAIESPTGVYAGYGFAVPVSIARIAMDQFKKYGHVRRPLLGVSINNVSAADAQAAGLKEIRGALVGSVTEGSGAEKAGLKAGDVIVSVDNKPISSVATLQRTVYGYQPGQTVTLAYARYGTQGTARVTLSEAPAEEAVASRGEDDDDAAAGATPTGKLGIDVQAVTPQLATQLRVPQSVRGVAIARVDPSGPAATLLGQGDVITAVIGRGGVQRPVLTGDQLKDAVNGASNGVVSLLVYNRQLGPSGGTRVVNVPIGQ